MLDVPMSCWDEDDVSSESSDPRDDDDDEDDDHDDEDAEDDDDAPGKPKKARTQGWVDHQEQQQPLSQDEEQQQPVSTVQAAVSAEKVDLDDIDEGEEEGGEQYSKP